MQLGTGRRTATIGLVFFSTLLLAPSRAGAVIVSGPDGAGLNVGNGYVGIWNGSSGVAVGERWVLSAKHVGGGVGGEFIMDGRTYVAEQVVQSRLGDLQLIRLSDDLPGWHSIGTVAAGDEVVIGGAGYTRGATLENGYAWSSSRQITWGENVVDAVGQRMMIIFDAPGSERALPGEASFSLHDSGGGLFARASDGSLVLAGLAQSISGLTGSTLWGSASFAITLEPFSAWIEAIVAPGRPVASSIAPPARGTGIQAPPPPVPTAGSGIVAAIGACLLAARRRR